jgi:hypothetical protein
VLVQIDEEVYAKVMHWINKAPGEVSGLGKVQLVDGIFMVTSAILLKQENTSTTTEIDASAIGKAMFLLKDEPGHLNWWWHSHVNMGVFWSGTDIDAIKDIGKNGWCLATVFNKKEDVKSAYYQKGSDFMPEVFADDIETEHTYIATEGEIEDWNSEYDENVKTKPYTPPKARAYTGQTKANIYVPPWATEFHNPFTAEIPSHREDSYKDFGIRKELDRISGKYDDDVEEDYINPFASDESGDLESYFDNYADDFDYDDDFDEVPTRKSSSKKKKGKK